MRPDAAMAERAQPTIRITDRDGRQAARPGHHVRGTVANRLTGVNVADLQDSRLQADNLAHRVGPARLRVDAVERRSRPDKIEMVFGTEKDAGRGREARRHAAEAASRRQETRALLLVQLVRRLVGAGEVAQQCPPAERPRPPEVVGEAIELARGQAEPRHSGVEVQHRRQGSARGCELLPFGDLAGIVQHRDEAGCGELLGRTRHRPVEHCDLARFREGLAQAQRLVEGGDKKVPASGRGQRSGDDRGAQAVAVGLDHRGALRRSHPLRQKAPVRDNARDIDFEHRRCTVGRVGSHVRPRFRREGRSPI